jgi:Protein of unknown function (DUF5672)
VTLCAATSTNVDATLAAIAASSERILFGDVLLLTHSPAVKSLPGGRVEQIAPLHSAGDYSRFLLERLADHVRTPHCLVIQWDGFVIHPEQWDERFLEFDYIGAPWPQFRDEHAVGNGGFSLRSRRLLEACQDARFSVSHPEDLAICRTNRQFLESEYGIRFGDLATARRFAFERMPSAVPTFGFHGVFNMIPALGPDRFWEIYSSLDDKQTAFVDYGVLMRQLGTGERALGRRLRLSIDLVRGSCKEAVSSR